MKEVKIDDFSSEILQVFASFPMILSRNADSQQYILTILIPDNNSSIAVNEVVMLYFENASRMVRIDINTTMNLSLCIYYQLLSRNLLVKIPGILPKFSFQIPLLRSLSDWLSRLISDRSAHLVSIKTKTPLED